MIDESVRHFVSDETAEELLEVLTREETLSRFPEYNIDDVKEFVADIVYVSTYVKEVTESMHLPRDVDDEPYLNLAICVEADYLVTTDNDLLDLMTGIDLESKLFRQRFRRLKIVHPRKFLKAIDEINLGLRP